MTTHNNDTVTDAKLALDRATVRKVKALAITKYGWAAVRRTSDGAWYVKSATRRTWEDRPLWTDAQIAADLAAGRL